MAGKRKNKDDPTSTNGQIVKKRVVTDRRRWSDPEVRLILSYMEEGIKAGKMPEKPTAQIYYTRMIKVLNMQGVTHNLMVNKIRNLRTGYMRAKGMSKQTGQGLAEGDTEGSIEEKIIKSFKWYLEMDRIYGEKSNVRIPYIKSATQIGRPRLGETFSRMSTAEREGATSASCSTAVSDENSQVVAAYEEIPIDDNNNNDNDSIMNDYNDSDVNDGNNDDVIDYNNNNNTPLQLNNDYNNTNSQNTGPESPPPNSRHWFDSDDEDEDEGRTPVKSPPKVGQKENLKLNNTRARLFDEAGDRLARLGSRPTNKDKYDLVCMRREENDSLRIKIQQQTLKMQQQQALQQVKNQADNMVLSREKMQNKMIIEREKLQHQKENEQREIENKKPDVRKMELELQLLQMKNQLGNGCNNSNNNNDKEG